MQRNEPERRREPRKTAERDARQPVAGQPPPDDGEEASLQKPEDTPSFLTARELQARDPAKSEDREKRATERDATASDAASRKRPGQKRGGG